MDAGEQDTLHLSILNIQSAHHHTADVAFTLGSVCLCMSPQGIEILS
jgi:hypothetical protein